MEWYYTAWAKASGRAQSDRARFHDTSVLRRQQNNNNKKICAHLQSDLCMTPNFLLQVWARTLFPFILFYSGFKILLLRSWRCRRVQYVVQITVCINLCFFFWFLFVFWFCFCKRPGWNIRLMFAKSPERKADMCNLMTETVTFNLGYRAPYVTLFYIYKVDIDLSCWTHFMFLISFFFCFDLRFWFGKNQDKNQEVYTSTHLLEVCAHKGLITDVKEARLV